MGGVGTSGPAERSETVRGEGAVADGVVAELEGRVGVVGGAVGGARGARRGGGATGGIGCVERHS